MFSNSRWNLCCFIEKVHLIISSQLLVFQGFICGAAEYRWFKMHQVNLGKYELGGM